jgi:hypothetical protein
MRKFIDYEKKAKAIEKGYCNLAKKVSYMTYQYINDLCSEEDYLEWEHLINDKEFDKELYKEAIKVNSSTYKRNQRLENRIGSMLLKGCCLFLTLTFRDDVLELTTEKTRRRYVHYFLKSISLEYVANIDYGSKNEREHYHAVVLCDFVSYDSWSYGNLDFKRVTFTNSEVKLSKYISKLTNHAIKESVKGNRVIYSRPRKDCL